MTLKETIYLSLAVCALIIGGHQITVAGFAASYWIFMLMIVFIILYQIEKNKRVDNNEGRKPAATENLKPKHKKRK